MHNRQLKKEVLNLLAQPDLTRALDEMARFPARRVVNPLFSFFHHHDQTIRWHAVTAMGTTMAGMAADQPESARVVMRRLMWSLNDESGGIGWGAPEAMGEGMARSFLLAEEFGAILVSYLNPRGSYIEHPLLQRGVLWGIGRLAHARPRLAAEAAALLLPFLEATDPQLVGLAAWGLGALPCPGAVEALAPFTGDRRTITIFMDGHFVPHELGRLAIIALEKSLAGAAPLS